MMRTPVRYYITKDEDRPIVRGVPVFVASPAPYAPVDAIEETAPAPVVMPRRANARRVGRLMRSTVRRRERASGGTSISQTD